MKISKLKDLIKLVEESKITELEVSRFGTKVRISKKLVSSSDTDSTKPSVEVEIPEKTEETQVPEREFRAMKAPMVGTFYRAAAPDANPYVEIGERIAARANVPLIDVGDVRRSAFKKTFGVRASLDEQDVLTEADVAAVNRRHNHVIMVLVGVLVILVSLGVFSSSAFNARSLVSSARSPPTTCSKTLSTRPASALHPSSSARSRAYSADSADSPARFNMRSTWPRPSTCRAGWRSNHVSARRTAARGCAGTTYARVCSPSTRAAGLRVTTRPRRPGGG